MEQKVKEKANAPQLFPGHRHWNTPILVTVHRLQPVYNFYQCLDRVDSLYYRYNQESTELSLVCCEHRADGALHAGTNLISDCSFV